MTSECGCDCPGEGKCHGCIEWCDHCGDVDVTCDAATCDVHRCQSCAKLLDRPEHEYAADLRQLYKRCTSCEIAKAMMDACDRGGDECAVGVIVAETLAGYRRSA